MTPNDRFALELGRALVRAIVAESERDQAKAQLAEFTNGVEDDLGTDSVSSEPARASS
jgi:hypothetical protein